MATTRAKATKAKVRAVRVAVTVDCTRCMRPIPVDAIAPVARCRACLYEIALEWTALAQAATAAAMKGAAGGRAVSFGGDVTVVSRISLATPVCAGCGTAIDADVLAATTTAHVCACETPLPVRKADELVRAIHGQAIAVAGERAAVNLVACEPVTFRCHRCGTGLRTDGTARAIGCVRCAVELDVPEALWNILYPVRPHPPLFLLIGGKR